jgi:hypothetical protein
MNDRNEPAESQNLEGMVAAGDRRLGCETLSPASPLDAVAELYLTGSVHLLNDQAALAEELPGALELDDPETEPVPLIGAKVPVDPGDRLVPGLGRG